MKWTRKAEREQKRKGSTKKRTDNTLSRFRLPSLPPSFPPSPSSARALLSRFADRSGPKAPPASCHSPCAPLTRPRCVSLRFAPLHASPCRTILDHEGGSSIGDRADVRRGVDQTDLARVRRGRGRGPGRRRAGRAHRHNRPAGRITTLARRHAETPMNKRLPQRERRQAGARATWDEGRARGPERRDQRGGRGAGTPLRCPREAARRNSSVPLAFSTRRSRRQGASDVASRAIA